ncbi:hypothetical protein [Limibacterium fermenti]|uniref:hypothetical protein n=1 Tax=Limibacterium fermenti TaxID=3229863 RepID=UPI003A5FA952
MDKRTLNFFGMTYTTDDLMQANLTRFEPYPQLNKDAVLLHTTLGTTGGVMKEVQIDISGATDDKTNAMMAAILKAVSIARRASVYPLLANNRQLFEQLDVQKTELTHLTQTALTERLNGIYDSVVSIQANIADMGVTPEEVAELPPLIAAFSKQKAVPRTLTAQHKTLNQSSLPALKKELRTILDRLDRLMLVFQSTSFYEDYRNARIIIDRTGHKPDEGHKGTK